MTYEAIKTYFHGGEISPRFHGQTQSERYPISMAKMENWVPTPYGTMTMRGGTQYVADAVHQRPLLETFRRAKDADICVEIGDSEIALWSPEGRVNSTPDVEFVTDPLWVQGYTHWNTAHILEKRAPHDYLPVNFVILPDEGWQGDNSVFDGGHVRTEPRVWQNVSVGSAQTVRVRADFTYQNIPNTFNGDASIGFIISLGNAVGDVSEFSVSDVHSHFDSDGSNIIHRSIDVSFPVSAGNHVLTIGFYRVFGIGNNFRGSIKNLSITSTGTTPAPITFPSVWTTEQLPDVKTAMDSGSGKMYLVHPNVAPQLLKWSRFTDVWTLVPAVLTGAPINWTGDNWPSAVAIHEGRLWLGGAPDSPSSIYASASDDYKVFTLPASTPSDPLSFILSTAGGIQWLHGFKDLQIGTDVSEVIGKSVSGRISFEDFSFPQQSSWGSADTTPVEVGSELVFISASRGKMRSVFDGGDRSNAYISEEVSYFGEHLFKNSRAKEAIYARDPAYALAVLRDDASIAVCTYNKELKLSGWYTLDVGGNVWAVAETNEISGTYMWAAIERGGITRIEYMSLQSRYIFALDSHSTPIPVPADRVVDGLDRFEGSEVRAVTYVGTDYRIHPLQIVTSGEITLPVGAVGQVAVGLDFTATAKTLRLEGDIGQGNLQRHKRRWGDIITRLNGSALPLINGERDDAFTAEIGNTQTLFTGDTSVRASDFEDEGTITIVQDLPIKTEIVGIFGQVDASVIN